MGSLLAQIPVNPTSADEVLSPYVYVFYVSFLLTFMFTPLMRTVAIHFGIIDRPDKLRKVHTASVAYLGGVAVFLGWLGGLAISETLRLHRIDPGWPTDTAGISHPMIRFGIVVGALVIIMLGLWDDIYKLKPWMKIVGQVCAAFFLLWDGIGVDFMGHFLEPAAEMVVRWFNVPVNSQVLPSSVLLLASSAAVVAVIVACCNATNLLDGLDGLCGGVTAVIAAGFLFIAVHLAQVGGGIYTNTDAQRVILGLALMGAVLGFTPYNFNPASIFMGDTGSMFLGFACGTMMILMGQSSAKWFLASTVIFALPILDTALAFARRWMNRRPLFSADKQHFHHQLVSRGFSVKQTVLISYGLAVFFGLLGIAMVYVRTRYAIGIYLVVFGSIIVAAYKMGMIHERPLTAVPETLDETLPEAFSPEVTPATVMEIPEPAEPAFLGGPSA